jgi:hypothetical protein
MLGSLTTDTAKTDALLADRERHVPRGLITAHPLVLERRRVAKCGTWTGTAT